jgi:hypothetical protein
MALARLVRKLQRVLGATDNGRATDSVAFEGDFSDREFEELLHREVVGSVTDSGSLIIFSEANPVTLSLARRLGEQGFRLGVASEEARDLPGVRPFASLRELVPIADEIGAIVVTSPVSRVIHRVFAEVCRYSALREVRFVYRIRSSEAYPLLNEYDQLREHGTVSTHAYITSQFDGGLFEDIYRYSLTKVQRKCQVRDAYDLFQCLDHARWIDGDLIEFGSYQGHSGLLVAEFIKRTGLDKKLYLCDAFEQFPDERLGIDQRWSGSHPVDFAAVESLFAPYGFVSLVRGEFEESVNSIGIDSISFAMIDCDSYRATRFVADFVFPKLVVGGVMFFEDYGHHALLGARRAADEFLAGRRKETFSMFSFFSGAYVAVRLA